MRKLRSIKALAHGTIQVLDPLFRLVSDGDDALSSPIPVTAVIPMHPKDLVVAGRCIAYLRKNLRHPLEEIVIVARDSKAMRDFAERHGCRFEDEDGVLGVNGEEVRRLLAPHGYTYWGWIFQQLLKLGADAISKSEHILIVDADTMLLRPKIFKLGNTLFQQFSHERNPLYLRSYRDLLDLEANSKLSYVCHYMFAEAKILQAFRRRIETVTGMNWVEAITSLAAPERWTEDELATDPFNFFSEYESYGNFCRAYYDEVKLGYFFNRGASDMHPENPDVDRYLQELPSIYCWASFHDYFYRDADAPKVALQAVTSSGQMS